MHVMVWMNKLMVIFDTPNINTSYLLNCDIK
jgi:hypothetical protein